MMATLLAMPVDVGEAAEHTPPNFPTGIVAFNLESNTRSGEGSDAGPQGSLFLGTHNGINHSMVGGHVKVFDGASSSSAAGHELGHIQTLRHEHIGGGGQDTIGVVHNTGANFLFGEDSVRFVTDGISSDGANFGALADEVDTTRAAKPLPVLLVLSDNRDLY